MRKQALVYKFLAVIALFLFVVSGCTVRSYTVVRERPDMEQEGNKGYLLGTAPEREDERKNTRDTYVFEVEFGKDSRAKQPKVEAAQIEASVVEPVEEEVIEVEYVIEDAVVVEEAVVEEPVKIEVESDFK